MVIRPVWDRAGSQLQFRVYVQSNRPKARDRHGCNIAGALAQMGAKWKRLSLKAVPAGSGISPGWGLLPAALPPRPAKEVGQLSAAPAPSWPWAQAAKQPEGGMLSGPFDSPCVSLCLLLLKHGGISWKVAMSCGMVPDGFKTHNLPFWM